MVTLRVAMLLAIAVGALTAAPASAAQPDDGIWYGGVSFRVVEPGAPLVANLSTNPGFPIRCGSADHTLKFGDKLAVGSDGTFSHSGTARGLAGLRLTLSGRFTSRNTVEGSYELAAPDGSCSSGVVEWSGERVDTPPGWDEAETRTARAAFLYCREFSNCAFRGVSCAKDRQPIITCQTRIKSYYSPGDAIRSVATFIWRRAGPGEPLTLVHRTGWIQAA